MMNCPNLKLRNGYNFPVVGLGTFQSESNEVYEGVKHALSVGYRHIDCAYFYKNEKEVGDAIREKIKDGTVKREDLFVTSKEGGDLKPIDENGILQSSDIDYLETWRGMEKVVELGLARSIGLSNFNSQQIDRVLSNATILPVVNQVECNPNINQKKLISFCKERRIVVAGFCPLGRVSSFGKPGFPNPTILEQKVIELSQKYGKTPAQLVLKYLVGLGISILSKSVKKERIVENLNIFDFELADEDVSYLDSLNCGKRVSDPVEMTNHKYYPFATEY